MRVIYVPNPEPESAFVITQMNLGQKTLKALRRRRRKVMKQPKFPPGWDEARVRDVLEHYEQQSDDEAVAEDEAAYESTTHEKVRQLAEALGQPESRSEATEVLRGLIDEIILTPDGGQLQVFLKGNLAAMLNAAQNGKRSPDTDDLDLLHSCVTSSRNAG